MASRGQSLIVSLCSELKHSPSECSTLFWKFRTSHPPARDLPKDMVSKIFFLTGDDADKKCQKILLGVFVLATVIIAISICIYTLRSGTVYWPVCPPPALSENGLSNWTTESEYITYACLPGFAMEGNETVMVSQCKMDDKIWIPAPPKCTDVPYLPILLNCNVTQNGMTGRISMWQEDDLSPTFISGYINTTNVNETQSAITEQILLSPSTCKASHELPIWIPEQVDCTNIDDCFNVRLNSTMLIPYQKLEIRIIIIFIDETQTAFFVTMHQNEHTIIMKEPLIVGHSTSTTTTASPSTTTTTSSMPPPTTTQPSSSNSASTLPPSTYRHYASAR